MFVSFLYVFRATICPSSGDSTLVTCYSVWMTVWYVYFFSVPVSDNYVSIIRRNICIYSTLVTCYSMWMTVWYAYFFSVPVSGNYVSIIRRNICIYSTLGTCYSVWMTVWYALCTPDDRHIDARNT